VATQTPGWYPDPNDSNSEVYWDGDRWHGRRPKLGATTGSLSGRGQFGDSTSRPKVIPEAWVLGWRQLPSFAQALIIIGTIVLVVIVISFLSSKPWESQREKDCRAAMQAEGYRGSQLDQAIKVLR
jgi:hypothetical protein